VGKEEGGKDVGGGEGGVQELEEGEKRCKKGGCSRGGRGCEGGG